MNSRLSRAAVLSAALHVLVVAGLLLGLPAPAPEEPPPEESVELAFVQGPPQIVTKAPVPAETPAPAVVPAPNPAPPAPEPPKPARDEPPPPPPPPPPPQPPPPAQPAPAPPVQAPPPPPTTPQPSPVPPPPPAPPSPPSPPLPVPPLPTPPVPPPPRPAPPSATSQPNATTNPAPDSKELNNTLERLRSLQKQTQPPTAKANPPQGGAPKSGGSPNGDVTARLTGAQRGAIGEQMRECWTKDAGALDLDRMSVLLTVTLDPAGVVRAAVVAPQDQAKLSDPRFRAFAERAIRAPMAAQCANLGQFLPKELLGQVNTLTFRFRP